MRSFLSWCLRRCARSLRASRIVARSRRLSPAALAGSATANLEQLAREYNETIAFIGKQLKKDPRLKPGDVQLNFEHTL